jgi:flavodoxin/uncharacterized protein YceK
MKRKILGVILAVGLLVGLTGCGSTQTTQTAGNSTQEAQTVVQETTKEQVETETESVLTSEEVTEVTEATETETLETEASETETSVLETSVADTNENETQAVASNDSAKVLVAYFSCTNTTKSLATTIANISNGTLYEIEAANPYTSADINYNDSSSRSTIEQNDSSVRPEIATTVSDMDSYDYIFIGFPIWWGEEPRIIDTFIESYDFTGKTVIPFCTSGGSGIGTAQSNIKSLISGTPEFKDGRKLNGNASEQDVSSWLNELGIEVK